MNNSLAGTILYTKKKNWAGDGRTHIFFFRYFIPSTLYEDFQPVVSYITIVPIIIVILLAVAFFFFSFATIVNAKKKKGEGELRKDGRGVMILIWMEEQNQKYPPQFDRARNNFARSSFSTGDKIKHEKIVPSIQQQHKKVGLSIIAVLLQPAKYPKNRYIHTYISIGALHTQ